jgi:hypothetical protein
VTSKRTAITGNPAEDVINPVFKEVEEVGLSWLRKVYGPSSVLDRRSRNVYFDAEVYLGSENLQKLDFKADQNFVRTGNLAWEDTIEYQSGQVVDGWGRKDLDLIFYIDPVTYTGILVRAKKLTRLVNSLRGSIRAFRVVNPGVSVGTGFTVPIDLVRKAKAIVWEGYL